MQQLNSNQLAGQNISSELAVSVYTNNTGGFRPVYVLLLMQGLAGDGDYNIAIRHNDGVTNFDSERTTLTLSAGQTTLQAWSRLVSLADGESVSLLIEGKNADSSITLEYRVYDADQVREVAGKVLGGGSSTITGVGARADNRDGQKIATQSLQPNNKPVVDGSGRIDINLDQTVNEPGSVPSWPAKVGTLLGWLLALARNKRITSTTTDTVRDDADNADLGSASLSDNGSQFDRGKYS